VQRHSIRKRYDCPAALARQPYFSITLSKMVGRHQEILSNVSWRADIEKIFKG